MQIIEGFAPLAPAMCLVTKRGDGPFLDLGNDFDFDHQGRMYVHCSVIRDMWNQVKHLYEGEDGTEAALAEKDAQIRALEAEVAELEAVVQSVYVLKQKGFTAQRKPGRPPKQKEPVANGS